MGNVFAGQLAGLEKVNDLTLRDRKHARSFAHVKTLAPRKKRTRGQRGQHNVPLPASGDFHHESPHWNRHTSAPSRIRAIISTLIGEAAAAVVPYFGRLGDARQAAATFPAIVAFHRALNGTATGDDLDALADRAQAAAERSGAHVSAMAWCAPSIALAR